MEVIKLIIPRLLELVLMKVTVCVFLIVNLQEEIIIACRIICSDNLTIKQSILNICRLK